MSPPPLDLSSSATFLILGLAWFALIIFWARCLRPYCGENSEDDDLELDERPGAF